MKVAVQKHKKVENQAANLLQDLCISFRKMRVWRMQFRMHLEEVAAVRVIQRCEQGARARRQRKRLVLDRRDKQRQHNLKKAATAMNSLNAVYEEGGLHSMEDDPVPSQSPSPLATTSRKVSIRSGSALMTVQDSNTSFSIGEWRGGQPRLSPCRIL